MHDSWARIGDLFHTALPLSPEARTAFLAEACGDDTELRRELAEMLGAHEGTGRLQVEERLLQNDQAETDTLIGRQIGAYRLERLLGRGGMGDVYLANRCDDQYRLQVAFKLVRSGLSGSRLAARFRQERQILAQLDHPNIATLLDGGVTDGGRPYLVMQYVDGLPITEYCTRHALGLRERLLLFATVCRAVQTAHSNFVVHRDLKPGNILVTAEGDAKLLDFGIAKLLDDPEAGVTVPYDRLLTPEHAAPEQVIGGPVTTATDVYALGVLLYEMLTETRPLDVTRRSAAEVERLVCATLPDAPSSRTGPLARALRGDLDNIVLMALRKEPERRYQSARELADDIANHLAGRPVRARGDTLGYRTRKFIQRNRWGVAAASTLLALAAGFVGVTVLQGRRVADERDRAHAEQAKAERVVDVLAELLIRADPRATNGQGADPGDFADLIGGAVEEMRDQPDVQARLWELLARVYQARSRFEAARDCLDQALAIHELEPGNAITVARLKHGLAQLAVEIDGNEAAIPLLRSSLATQRKLLGDRHPDVSIAAQNLAAALRETKPAEAESLLSEARETAEYLAPVQPGPAAALHNQLGVKLMAQRDHVAARTHFEQALALMMPELGPRHPDVLTVEHNLATCLGAAGNWREAERMQRRILTVRQQILGPQAVATARSWDSLGCALANLGRFEEALAAFAAAKRSFASTRGPRSAEVSSTIRNIGVVHMAENRPDSALANWNRVVAIDRARAGGPGRAEWRRRGDRALALHCVGRTEEALSAARAALAAIDDLATRPTDAYRADLRTINATILLDTGQFAEAAHRLREAVAIRAERPDDEPFALARDRCLLGAALAGSGHPAEARRLLQDNQRSAQEWKLIPYKQLQLITAALENVEISTR